MRLNNILATCLDGWKVVDYALLAVAIRGSILIAA